MSFRLLLTLSTLTVLLYGIFELKSFLNVHFIENDTPLKAKLTRILNGETL